MARRLLLSALLLTAASAASAASSASAQLKPSDAPAIAAAVQDCSAAADASGVSEARLVAGGWAKASMSSDGKPVDAAFSVYGKAGANPIITTDAAGSKAGTICVVMAGLSSQRDYQGVVDALDAIEGVSAVGQEKLTITFASSKHIIQSDLTGNRDKPSVRVAVMAISPEKK